MVAGADGAELVTRHALEVADDLGLTPKRAVEQLMLDLLGIAAAEPEADFGGDLVDDGPDAVGDRLFGTSSFTAMLPQAMSKPTPLTEMCSS